MGINELLDAYEARVKTLPLGHEIKHRGCSTYNWKMAVLMELREMAAVSTPQPNVDEGEV